VADVVERLNAALEGRYRIERELGAGGMATVWLAEDLKHDRKVAVKVLKPELTAVLGADRFIQEIKTTASLQHPHILPLFDSGSADGFLYYVMPYIEGETLRDKLDRETQLGIDEAVRITREVADALDYAHRHGIIHRDIKPENILLHDGRPMVADFGIALAVSAAAGGRMTETGTSVGTPHYMSPEQATGDKQITGRADIYSLASVLYEMLTGEPPHSGASAQAVIMKIIADTPRQVMELRKSVPPNVAAAVMMALEKLPADRFESAKSFADALADPAFTISTLASGAAARADVRAIRWWIRSPWSWALMAVVVALAAGLLWLVDRPGPERPVTRFEITLPRGLLRTPVDISRDGTRIVSRAGDSIYIRDLDDLTVRALHLPGAAPRLSWDGRTIAYSVGTEGLAPLNVVSVEGGTPTTILDSVGINSQRWGDDGYIYLVRNGTVGRVPAAGGTFEALMPRDSTISGRDRTVDDVLPGGRGVVISNPLRVIPLDGSKPDTLGRLYLGRVLPGGYLTYVERDRVMVAPFDPRSLRVTGPSLPIADSLTGGVGGVISTGGAYLPYSIAWSDEGTVIYMPGARRWRVLLASSDGAIRALPGVEYDGGPTLPSPDGSRLAVERNLTPGPFRGSNVWIYDRASGASRPVTFGTDSVWRTPVAWSADGSRVYFRERGVRSSLRETPTTVLVVDVENPGRPDTAFALPDPSPDVTMAPDRRTFVWTPGTPAPAGPGLTVRSIWSAVRGAEDAREVLTIPAGTLRQAVVSPDGQWIAYVSSETGQGEVYVQAFPGGGRKLQISSGGGFGPFWAESGRSVFYTLDDQLREARVDLQAGRVTGREVRIDHRSSRLFFHDVLPGDSLFLGTTGDYLPGEAARFVVVQGMLGEIERRMRGQR
jgi:Tol biopolymer transport system component